MAEIEYNPRVVDMDDELDDEELDETLTERLVGLTEMFPEWVRRSVATSADWTWWATKSAAGLAQSTLWVVSTSALIMVVPYAIEKERSDMEKSQMAQQRQMLLGPSAAVSAAKVHQSPMH